MGRVSVFCLPVYSGGGGGFICGADLSVTSLSPAAAAIMQNPLISRFPAAPALHRLSDPVTVW